MQSSIQIGTQPADQLNLLLGTQATFSVQATSANPPLRYQWRLNDVNIPGATNNLYVVPVDDPTVSGLYSVIIYDSKSATISSHARLSVGNLNFLKSDMLVEAPLLTPTTNGFIRSDNFGATKEAGEPRHSGKKGTKSVWFKWIAPATGVVTFTTAGSDFDTLLGAYIIPLNAATSVTNCVNAVNADYDDDDQGGYLTSQIIFNATLGQAYWIAVDGFGKAEGNIILKWDLDLTTETLPSVTSRTRSSVVAYGDSVNIAAGISDANGYVTETRWYFNRADTSVLGTNYGVVKMTENSIGAYYVRLRTRSDKRVNLRPANFQINIQADGSADTNQFTLDKFADVVDKSTNGLTVTTSGSPTLQSFGGPSPETGGPAAGYTSTQIFSTQTSSKEPGEPDHCSIVGGSSEWFSYTPPANGYLHVNTDGSSYDTILAIYTNAPPGNSFTNLVPIACDDNSGANGLTSKVITPVTGGAVYYIVIDGVNGARGTAKLNINFGDRALITNGPASQAALPGTNVTFAVGATGSTPIAFQWRTNGVNIPGATNSAYTVTNISAAKAGVYTVVVSNLINITTSSANLDVFLPPTITAQPVSRSVAQAGTGILSVAATGFPAPSYQWQFGGVDIAGATNASLTLTNFQSLQEGMYHAVVTNSMGTVTSTDAQLLINAPTRLASYGLDGSRNFRFELVGLGGSNYVFEATTNFLTWTPLRTNSDPTGLIIFTDSNAAPGLRFFRTRLGP